MIGRAATGSRCYSPAPSMARTIWRNSLIKTVFAARLSTVINRRAHVPARWPPIFKSGDIRVLVATDIAARGLDIIEELPHVVNGEPPNVPEDFVQPYWPYRRAAAISAALSLVCVDEHKLLRYRKVAEKRSYRITTPGYEPTRRLKRADSEWSSAARRRQSWTRTKIREERGAAQQPRRQDSGAAKAKPKPRTGEETRWRQSSSAASPAQNLRLPSTPYLGNMPVARRLPGLRTMQYVGPDKVLAPSSGKIHIALRAAFQNR